MNRITDASLIILLTEKSLADKLRRIDRKDRPEMILINNTRLHQREQLRAEQLEENGGDRPKLYPP